MSITSLPTIYNTDARGSKREWTISVQNLPVVKDNGETITVPHIVTVHGIVGKKLTTASKAIYSGKGIGKAHKTPEEQAVSEATSTWELKSRDTKYSPMLAHDFTKHKHKLKYPVIGQPKMDGRRGVVYREGDQVYIISRTYIDCKNPLPEQRKELLDLLDPEGKDFIDCELWSMDIPRAKIVGLCNKKTFDSETERKTKLLKVNIFDYGHLDQPNLTFTERYEIIKTKLEKAGDLDHVSLTENVIINNEEEAEEAHTDFVSQGYEGLIIRIPQSTYKHSRTDCLLKYKHFEENEFTIVGYHEGQGAWEGAVVFELGFGNKVNNVYEYKFSAKPRGTISELRELYKDGENYIGKLATVRYQTLMDGKEGPGTGPPEFGTIVELDRTDI